MDIWLRISEDWLAIKSKYFKIHYYKSISCSHHSHRSWWWGRSHTWFKWISRWVESFLGEIANSHNNFFDSSHFYFFSYVEKFKNNTTIKFLHLVCKFFNSDFILFYQGGQESSLFFWRKKSLAQVASFDVWAEKFVSKKFANDCVTR